MITYNGARWVRSQAESIAQQTRRPDEVIIADDGSSDGTVELALAVLGPLRERTRVLPPVERPFGVTANIERAVVATSGDVVVLADQDDRWRSDKLAAVERWAARSTAGGMFSDGRIIDADGAPTGETLWGRAGFNRRARRRWPADNLAELLRRPVATGASMAIRRSALDLLLPLPAGDWHDYSASLLLAATSGLDLCPDPLIDYRLHGGNTAGLGAERRRDRVLDAKAHRANLDRQIQHLESVADRLSAAGYDAAAVRICGRQETLRRRHGLPAPRWRRAPGVVRLLGSGRYHRHGQGWPSAIRDLLWR